MSSPTAPAYRHDPGRCLEAILLKALAVARRVRTETEIVSNLSLNSSAPVELARQLYGDFEKRGLVIFAAARRVSGSPNFSVTPA